MKQQILIIHGGEVFNTYEEFLKNLNTKEVTLEKFKGLDWKYNLGEDLGEDYEVLNPKMPNFHNAKYSEWKIWFERIIPHLDNEIILIGHSLGGIFLAKYLSENEFPKKIKLLILVAAPFNTPALHPLTDFILTEPLTKLNEQAKMIILFHSTDDMVVPFSNSQNYLIECPNIKMETFQNMGHFNQDHFPELINQIKRLSR